MENAGNFDSLVHVPDLQLQIDFLVFPDGQADRATLVRLKASFGGGDFVLPNRQGGGVEQTRLVRYQCALRVRLQVFDHDRGAGDRRIRRVRDLAPKRRIALGKSGKSKQQGSERHEDSPRRIFPG